MLFNLKNYSLEKECYQLLSGLLLFFFFPPTL